MKKYNTRGKSNTIENNDKVYNIDNNNSNEEAERSKILEGESRLYG